MHTESERRAFARTEVGVVIIVRCSACGGKVTEADGYPTIAAAMRDLADHGIDVTGDRNDPEIRCERCTDSGSTSAESTNQNGQRPSSNGRFDTTTYR